ncbi:unnamed protein product [Paramecium sonneborni]|uniref:Uncharacterized protein n=1 Tax=Paramecium sonneborni TaxID=65129 RepID=A0A8S1N459_9CILI|nr:unnamed protein product [Paramecium sonneborni]
MIKMEMEKIKKNEQKIKKDNITLIEVENLRTFAN